MPDEDLEKKFPDIEAVDRFLARSRIHLMDINHNVQKSALSRVEDLKAYQMDVNNLIEEMMQAEAVGAMLVAQTTADKIQADFGIIHIDDVEDSEEEDEEE